jgi:hypothetical protein
MRWMLGPHIDGVEAEPAKIGALSEGPSSAFPIADADHAADILLWAQRQRGLVALGDRRQAASIRSNAAL